MKCPNCDQLLLITERQNVEIDYCPSCRGVWLDRGELDKIIQFSNQHELPDIDNRKNEQESSQRDYKIDSNKYDSYQTQTKVYGKYPKKKSFLGDLFDFD
jgi:Zn-finger nucleic acid-binding protein